MPTTLDRTLAAARGRLLAERAGADHWAGELSASALSTATAVTALALVDGPKHDTLIRGGIRWLAAHQNADGGWGDTAASASNISTTLLGWAAFAAVGVDRVLDIPLVIARAEKWIAEHAGGLDAATLARAVDARYGNDRTFSAPILTMAALSGRLGARSDAWRYVYPLPFELAACPHGLWKFLRLPVVSYALPALIAIGQVRQHFRPSRNPFTWLLRRLTRARTLRVLTEIQPASGGFLEAAPLTSFVAMSLAGAGRAAHPVAVRAAAFLAATARPDGSWPIDTNLATWVTTLAVSALAPMRKSPVAPPPSAVSVSGSAPPRAAVPQSLPPADREAIRRWLLGQQHCEEHPYTHAAPGGWAWTDLSGGVPDADDAAGALVALRRLGPVDDRTARAATAGVRWLVGLQNRDGGIPTFCRGWGALPFDRSSPDLTAHALQAWAAWHGELPPDEASRVAAAIGRATAYLVGAQSDDGAWTPLWFGNQFAPDNENPTYGTARVLMGLAALVTRGSPESPDTGIRNAIRRGADWLLAAQRNDGGWGGAYGVPASIEETALAVDALARLCIAPALIAADPARAALGRGVAWLLEHTAAGTRFDPAPIGFYFAKLWYFERLYPVIFTVSALEHVRLVR